MKELIDPCAKSECPNSIPVFVSDGRSCGKNCEYVPSPYLHTQKMALINNVVRVSSSEYVSRRASLCCVRPWTGKSDQIEASVQSKGGVGVDVKHGSYERYLNRLKGRHLKR